MAVVVTGSRPQLQKITLRSPVCGCVLTRREVVMFDHVALQAAPRGEVLGAVGHGAAAPERAGVLLVLLGVDIEAAARRELGIAACQDSGGLSANKPTTARDSRLNPLSVQRHTRQQLYTHTMLYTLNMKRGIH